MKKIFMLTIIIIAFLMLPSCFEVTKYPDMVEYTEEEVLGVAKEKYNVTEWIFKGVGIKGEAAYNNEGNFKVDFYDIQFSTNFVNGDNTEAAMTAFAGKNGGHDVQGHFSNFLCYVALGECADGSLKFVYYNTNIHKNAEIADTVGASDYSLEVLPADIKNELFTVDSEWTDMQSYLNAYKNGNPRGFIYSGNRLSFIHRERYGGISYIEFYKENGEIVFDLYYDNDEYDREDNRRLIYSTSNRYGVIYNYYGLDKSQYFNITQNVSQSTEQESCMALKGHVEAKEIDGTVIYSRILYCAEYQVERNGKVTWHGTTTDTVYDSLNFERGWIIDKIDGIDHTQTAKFILSDFYILYEKNVKSE